MPKKRKVLIIKTGFSEFLDREISTTVSLGDVLSCTSILHLFKEDTVTWLTSMKGRPLLEENPYIHEILTFGPKAFKEILKESYDILINLEKDIGICVYISQVDAKKRYGFYFDERIHDILTYKRSTRYLLSGQENHGFIQKNGIQLLFDAVGGTWNGEGPILGRKVDQTEIYDIGFNYAVGTKWPTKAWPEEKWQSLENLLKDEFKISWQKGHKDLFQYMEWIASCRLIVTSDSLGQILGQALNKKVIALYGPTNHLRMSGIPNIHILTSTLDCPFKPCYASSCKYDKFCMDYIEPTVVAAKCKEILAQ